MRFGCPGELFDDSDAPGVSSTQLPAMRPPAQLVVPLALLAAACGSSSPSSNTSTPAASPTTSTTNPAQQGITKITTQRVPGGIGAILANRTGLTLYVFLPEKGGKIKCVGQCAAIWPPLLAPSAGKPATTSAVHPQLVGTVKRPTGGSSITYAGWPLHTYTADTGPGSYKGQGYGGQWYMISPSGQVITKPVTSGTSSGGGYG